MTDVTPHPKDAQLARGEKRYRRKVASPKQWQAISAEKVGPCRVCGDACANGHMYGKIQLHHLVARVHGGDDLADNIVPVCPPCHQQLTERNPAHCRLLLIALTDAEYAYMVGKGGEDYAERAYGTAYTR